MELKFVGETAFEEMNLPPVLYKYRTWNDSNHRNIIIKREVYFSKFSDFEDKTDCQIPVRFDLMTDEDILNFFILDSKVKNTYYTEDEHIKFAIEAASKSSVKDKEFVDRLQKLHIKRFNEHFGVLSLTLDVCNLKMWQKYAHDFKGFAVGFNPEVMFTPFGGGSEVQYYEELPIIHAYPQYSLELQYYLQTYSKLKIYKFEKEYRTHKMKEFPMTIKDRIVKIPANAYSEIVISERMNSKHRKNLLQSIPKELKDVPIKIAKFKGNSVRLELI